MITRFIEIEGDDHGIHSDTDIYKRSEFFGKSSDTKPTKGVRNADIFYEMDTQTVFLFDEDDGVWLAQ